MHTIRKILLILLICASLIGVLVCYCAEQTIGVAYTNDGYNYSINGFYVSLFELGWISFLILAVLLTLLLLVKCNIWKNAEQEQAKQQAREEAELEKIRRREDIRRSVEDGTFQFPVEALYNKAQEASITKFNSEYEMQKGKMFVDEILASMDVQEDLGKYFYNKVEQLYEQGKNSIEEKNTAETIKRIEREKAPFTGNLSKDEESVQENNDNWSKFCNTAKRKYILESTRETIKQQANEERKLKANQQQLAMHMLSSAPREREQDWAITGGFASAIAGPAAGVAMATDAMLKNQEIRKRNAENQAISTSAATALYMSSLSENSRIDALDAKARWLTKEIGELQKKVVLSDTAENLFDKLVIKTTVQSKASNSKVSVNIVNNYKPDVPNGISMVTDGAIKVRLLCDTNTLIDEIWVAFPLYGIECGSSETIIGYTKQYMQGNHVNYRAEVIDKKLWIMER